MASSSSISNFTAAESRFLQEVVAVLTRLFGVLVRHKVSVSVFFPGEHYGMGGMCASAGLFSGTWYLENRLDVAVFGVEDTVRLWCWDWVTGDTIEGQQHKYRSRLRSPNEGSVLFTMSAADRVRLALGGTPPVPDLGPRVIDLMEQFGYPTVHRRGDR